jgi:hypothetical protein
MSSLIELSDLNNEKYIPINDTSNVTINESKGCCWLCDLLIFTVLLRIMSFGFIIYQIYSTISFVQFGEYTQQHNNEEYFFESECYSNFTKSGSISDITDMTNNLFVVYIMLGCAKLCILLFELCRDYDIYYTLNKNRKKIRICGSFKTDKSSGCDFVILFVYLYIIGMCFGILLSSALNNPTNLWLYDCRENFIPTKHITDWQTYNSTCVYYKGLDPDMSQKIITCINVIEKTKYGFITYQNMLTLVNKLKMGTLIYTILNTNDFIAKIVHMCCQLIH